MPALLTENGFIDTVADANQLKDSNFITKIARGHVQGLETAFSLQKKKSQSPIYRVQIGAFKEKENAEKKQWKQLKRDLIQLFYFKTICLKYKSVHLVIERMRSV